eukprot:CAMPEP_0170518776 /NCGR_PEP_ID=MMETSP0209-20121228/4390_1 /TAXON_ID=665100 ORGANISM="Litonotus pictus, Strain P1" /NCGR_SAMPLE_ID=MMETSP0209 /ASSEMBLY_ACC=CAM_ASM_000301 /LENGTH=384 /DNA_ID=CAMNT_0010804461 /DNA_START=20 /DNA_END=1174 /DNA_ORIENTATION=-
MEHAVKKVEDRAEERFTYKFLNYGEVQGDLSLRKEISSFLTKDIMYKVCPSNIMITGGVSLGLEILCRSLLKPGDSILIETPTFFKFNKLFSDHFLNIYVILRKEDGELDMDYLESIVKSKDIKAFYTIPTCHNPIGCNLPLKQRNLLYNLSLKHKFYIFSDDIYEFFYFDEGKSRLPPLIVCSDEITGKEDLHRKEILEYDHSKNPYVISVNSFSKILCPGIRVGWIQADSSVIDKVKSLGWISSGGGMCNTMSHIVLSYMQLGFLDLKIKMMQENYRERVKMSDEVLKGSKAYTYVYPVQGYFFWLKLSDEVNVNKLKETLEQEKVIVLFGNEAVAEEFRAENQFLFLERRIRISFGTLPLEKTIRGFSLLRSIIENSLESK